MVIKREKLIFQRASFNECIPTKISMKTKLNKVNLLLYKKKGSNIKVVALAFNTRLLQLRIY